MAEELNRPAGSPEAAPQKAQTTPAPRHESGGDIPVLFENIGVLFDSTIGSVSKMLGSASSVTQQVIENINVTVNSDTVQEVVKNIGTVSGNVIDGVNATLSSEQLKNTINDLGNLAGGLIKTAESVATSEQAQNLFTTISEGLNQLVASIVSPVQMMTHKEPHKKAVQIPFCQKTPCEPAETAAAETAKASTGTRPEIIESGSSAPSGKEPVNKEVKPQGNQESPSGEKQNDPSRKGTFPRSKTN